MHAFQDDYGFEELHFAASPELDALLAPFNCAECLDDGEWLLNGIAEVFGSTSTDVSVDALYLLGDDFKIRKVENAVLHTFLARKLESQFSEHIFNLACDGKAFPYLAHGGPVALAQEAA